MKSFLPKLKISAALDVKEQLPPALSERCGRSRDIGQFEEAWMTLHRDLKASVPKPEAPASLHNSIMHAIHADVRADSETPQNLRLRASGRLDALTMPVPLLSIRSLLGRWLPAVGLAAALLLAAQWVAHRPAARSESPLAVAGSALELGSKTAQSMPVVVVGPLSDELQRVDHDVEATAQFLLASLP
jgi:hypothetical protein